MKTIPTRTKTLDAVIVGAGLSGLAAARSLAAAGLSFRVLEARERVGGRVLMTDDGDPAFDLGGQYVGPGQRRMLALMAELGLSATPTWSRGAKVMVTESGRVESRGLVPPLPVRTLASLLKVITRLERARKCIVPGAPASSEALRRLDQQSMRQWLHAETSDPIARRMMELSFLGFTSATADKLSALFGLMFVQSGHGFWHLTGTRNGAQDARINPGAQALAQAMADPLREHIALGQPVLSIHHDERGVVVRTPDQEVHARFAIMAVPPPLAAEIDIDPKPPAARDAFNRGTTMSSAIKCIVGYERPFWRDAGLSGEIIAPGRTASIAFDNSALDGTLPALVVFVRGDAALQLAHCSKDERRARVVADLVDVLGPTAASPIRYWDFDWSAERWTGGVHGIFGPGLLSETGVQLDAATGRLLWAGTENAKHWHGHMEGALEAGYRAAHQVKLHGSGLPNLLPNLLPADAQSVG